MLKISSYLKYAFAALAMCFGSFAFAATDPVQYGYTLKHALADAGAYGALSAQFKAEQAQMLDERTSNSSGNAGLVKASHGFMQAAADEVTKGTTGSTVGLYHS